jgi:LAS superfamily LD-carboxypeptidase LdcB
LIVRAAAATGLALLLLASCASPDASSSPATSTPAPPDAPAPDTLEIGTGATDTFGGWLPDGVMLSPFDVSSPVVALLDPALLKAVQDAAHSAAANGIDMKITSGWRSKGFQQRLFDDAVRDYGSVDIARQFVASPEMSEHVTGEAVDIAPVDADHWLIRNGPRFGLCQIYANEIWHFELAVDEQGRCPPLKPNAAG